MAVFSEKRTAEHQANLAGYAFLVFAVTLILLYAGGFTTTIGAGMVFLDWPLSNGSLNPPGWVADEAMLAEHSHRLLGMTVGSLAIGLAVWMYLREARRWLRWLSYGVLGLVVLQGLLGGMRVLLVSLHLAQVHGVVGQLFLCSVVAVAVGASRWWRSVPTRLSDEAGARWRHQRLMGLALCALLIVQLVVGAVMRHNGAGLAIPYFPHAAPDGSLLPPAWTAATTIHFAHRAIAVLITAVLVPWAAVTLRSPQATPAMKRLAGAALVLLLVQIGLGAGIIWSLRKPIETTLHVLNGALLLSCCWAITLAYCRCLLAEERALGATAGGSAPADRAPTASASGHPIGALRTTPHRIS